MPPSPSRPSHHPFGAYPFLYRLRDGSGEVLLYFDYRLDGDHLDDLGVSAQEDIDALRIDGGSITVMLPGDIGARLIERFGPSLFIYTLPFAGVEWSRNGTLLSVKVDREERFGAWLGRVEEELNRKARRQGGDNGRRNVRSE